MISYEQQTESYALAMPSDRIDFSRKRTYVKPFGATEDVASLEHQTPRTQTNFISQPDYQNRESSEVGMFGQDIG